VVHGFQTPNIVTKNGKIIVVVWPSYVLNVAPHSFFKCGVVRVMVKYLLGVTSTNIFAYIRVINDIF
jgi:hypothetical protein